MSKRSEKELRQQIADAYGAGQIKQALIAGEYPPPPLEYPTGTISGRWSHTTPPFKELEPSERRIGPPMWPWAYMSGPVKLSEVRASHRVSESLASADFSKLEERVLAWHLDTVEKLKAAGYEPAGDGLLSDTWIKKEKKDA